MEIKFEVTKCQNGKKLEFYYFERLWLTDFILYEWSLDQTERWMIMMCYTTVIEKSSAIFTPGLRITNVFILLSYCPCNECWPAAEKNKKKKIRRMKN